MTPTSALVPPGPLTPPRTLGQRRTRWNALALAVCLMALGGLLSGFAFLTATRIQSCLAVSRAVAAGATISTSDLRTVQITVAPGLLPIKAKNIRDAVGKRAAVTLVPGTLLTAAQITDEALVRPDQRQVGVGLPANRMPARTLHPGDRVQLVSTPPEAANASAAPVLRFDATVVDLSGRGGTGVDGWVVHVAVAERDATAVVTLAAQSRLTIVLRVGG
ncbi:SAF domain-containing protein [Virgisporangium aurantiacum]|uniref:SAF domain-containing protein n=1 Tax=Virgisporangium aurantiacum TaxID=175570 RepID=A0A8J3Z756_9ACTN|nr:SAF domain-containing protein [Virgisporangium aurantiacum]GIJ56150.1 hypothetical protein Vau01_036660 [Virgisporangium aurantiacum]